MRQILRNPFATGSITPSGAELTRLMVEALSAKAGEVVVEFCPGTGVFTRALLAAGVAPEKLILIEFSPVFAKFLSAEFPGVHVIEGSAADLPRYLAELKLPPVGKIISGLPLRSMNQQLRNDIAHAVATSLEAGGTYVQFSYFRISPLPKILAGSLGLAGKCVGTALKNIPPAFVWKYIKSGKDHISA